MFNMLANIYLCTFKSDKGLRDVKVITHSFGRAATIAIESIRSWEDREAYELISVQFYDICFLNLNLSNYAES